MNSDRKIASATFKPLTTVKDNDLFRSASESETLVHADIETANRGFGGNVGGVDDEDAVFGVGLVEKGGGLKAWASIVKGESSGNGLVNPNLVEKTDDLDSLVEEIFDREYRIEEAVIGSSLGNNGNDGLGEGAEGDSIVKGSEDFDNGEAENIGSESAQNSSEEVVKDGGLGGDDSETGFSLGYGESW